MAAANILAQPLRAGSVGLDDLRAVQRRRELPTRLTQGVQVLIQRRIISRVLGRSEKLPLPLALRLLRRCPFLRRIPARLIGLGFRPERVTVIPNGIEPLVALRPSQDVRRRLGLSERDFVAVLDRHMRGAGPERDDPSETVGVDALRDHDPRPHGRRRERQACAGQVETRTHVEAAHVNALVPELLEKAALVPKSEHTRVESVFPQARNELSKVLLGAAHGERRGYEEHRRHGDCARMSL